MRNFILSGLATTAVVLSGCGESKSPSHSQQDLARPLIQVDQTYCEKEDGTVFLGTATLLSDDTFLTSAHVVQDCKLKIGNRAFDVSYIDVENDIALFGEGRNFSQINCEILKYRSEIEFIGFPRGNPYITQSYGQVSGDVPDNFQWAFGFIEQGMSGGPVFLRGDRTEIHGIIKATRQDRMAWQFVDGPTLCASLKRFTETPSLRGLSTPH